MSNLYILSNITIHIRTSILKRLYCVRSCAVFSLPVNVITNLLRLVHVQFHIETKSYKIQLTKTHRYLNIEKFLKTGQFPNFENASNEATV